MTDTDTTEQTETKLAKITFSNGNYCYADIKDGQTTVNITSIKGLFDKNGGVISNTFISELINWDKEEITIDYIDDKMTYNGKIDKEGKLCGIGVLTYNNGYKYKGDFKNGTWHGKGILLYTNMSTNTDTIIYDGYFENGELKDKKTIKIIEGDLTNGKCKIIISNEQKYIDRTIECTIKNGIIDVGENKFILGRNDKYKGNNYENHTVSGKLNGMYRIVYEQHEKNIDRTIEAEFIDGEPKGESSVTFGLFDNPKYYGLVYKNKFDIDAIKKIGEENWKLTGKGTLIQKSTGTVFKGNLVDGKLEGEGEIIYVNSSIANTFKGNIKGGEPYMGILTYRNGSVYQGFFTNGMRTGKGELTVNNEKTGKSLYTEVYNENGIMENVEYVSKNEDDYYRITINYDEINRALNRNGINKTKDLRKYVTIYDKNGNKIANKKKFNFEIIKQCAQYQMQARLENENGKLDDKNRMNSAYTGLQNLIIFAEVIDNIKALKRIRFAIQQNNFRYPTNIYDNIELFLNSLGLTMEESPPENSGLISIDELLNNNIDYISINMQTTARDHVVCGVIDLKKLKQLREKKLKGATEEELKELKKFIYVYDTSRIIDNQNVKGDLGQLQEYCQIFNHVQQELGSCWYNTACSVIAAAIYLEIIEKIRNGEIKQVGELEKYVSDNTEFNELETLQMMTLQTVAKDLKVERLGEDNKKMMHQIVRQDIRNAIKKMIEKHNGQTELLEIFGIDNFGAYATLMIENEQKIVLNKYNQKSKTNKFKESRKIENKLLAKLKEKLKNKNDSKSQLSKKKENKKEYKRLAKKLKSLGYFTQKIILEKIEKEERKVREATQLNTN